MNDILSWMEGSILGRMMQEITWLFPCAEIFHFIGLSLLMGSILVVDIRLLGFSRDIPLDVVYKFLPITVIGFSINLFTGIMFFFNDPFRYYPNLAFRLKMLLLVLAGINAIYFASITRASSNAVGTEDSKPKFKIIAALSLLFWISIIVCGRLIPYLE
jgi:hypothetical protein